MDNVLYFPTADTAESADASYLPRLANDLSAAAELLKMIKHQLSDLHTLAITLNIEATTQRTRQVGHDYSQDKPIKTVLS